MSNWSLAQLLSSLHDDLEQRLSIARKTFGHPVSKGDASEQVWLALLQTYLPVRYQVETAYVVDSKGVFSDQLDIVVFDRQYSPFIFRYQEQTIIPAESVYAVFEAKQTISREFIEYAQKKVASVRRLHRTSLPIPYAAGVYPPKMLGHILGGIVTLESEWNPPLGEALMKALRNSDANECLDLGCIASHGVFECDQSGCEIKSGGKPATRFLFELISQLQDLATVPMIDIRAYAAWLTQ